MTSIQASTQPRTILLTGFGPFPGMPFNVSVQVAHRLADAARARWPQHIVEAYELPTEWIAGPDLVHRLWGRLRPDIALHFGVASEAPGMQIETSARNNCRMDPDASGALPLSPERIAGGRDALAASLPIDAIMRRLQVLRVPSCISEDAGAYLCNAVLYESVVHASVARPVALAGFVHIPPHLDGVDVSGQHGDDPNRCSESDFEAGALDISAHDTLGPEQRETVAQPSAGMSIDALVVGGLAILECSLEHLSVLRSTEAADNQQHS